MAAQSGSSGSGNVQELVQSILNAVTCLQHTPQPQQEIPSRPAEESAANRSNFSQFASPSDELNSRFQIPRGRGSNCATTNISFSSPQPPTRILSTDFNPRRNYSFQRTVRRKPKRSNESDQTKKKSCNVLFKDVCLLPGPEWNQVPRGPTKSALIERGLFVDAFQLDKDWTESRLYNELSALLSDSGVTISAILFRIRY
jgi:hypothetical protein